MVKKLFSVLLCVSLVLSLCGCSEGVEALKEVKPISLDEVIQRRVVTSNEEVEAQIFKYVSNNFVIERDNLIEATPEDVTAVGRLMSDVNIALQGGDNNVLSDEAMNYLLLLFGSTPYEWTQVGFDVVGFDGASRFYFVDVMYSTTGNPKLIVPESKIPKGAEDEIVLKKNRLEDFLMLLNRAKEEGFTYMINVDAYEDINNSVFETPETTKPAEGSTVEGSEQAGTEASGGKPVAPVEPSEPEGNNGLLWSESETKLALETFEERWGTIKSVFEEQSGTSLYERVKLVAKEVGGIGKFAYSGFIDDSGYNDSAIMTLRFVLGYRYNLGEVEDLVVKHFYIKDYKVDGTVPSEFVDGGKVPVLKPFVDRLINSYFKAVSEYNYVGLYSLMENYAGFDKYFNDLHESAYLHYGGYTFDIVSVDKEYMYVLVTCSSGVRPKGGGTSLPNYEDKILFKVALCDDDTLRIANEYLLSKKLVGEPLTIVKSVGGISDMIQYNSQSFTHENEIAVMNTLSRFSKVVFGGESSGAEFTSLIDHGISGISLRGVMSTIETYKSTKKVTYLSNFSIKSNVFVSIDLREIYDTPDGVYDTEALLDLVNRDGVWKVSNYTRTKAFRLESMPSDEKALIIDTTEGQVFHFDKNEGRGEPVSEGVSPEETSSSGVESESSSEWITSEESTEAETSSGAEVGGESEPTTDTTQTSAGEQ